MLQNKKAGSGALIAAGLAAFAYYKYSKMSAEEKENLVGDLKQKAQDLYDKYLPEEVKGFFNKKGTNATADTHFGEGSEYTG